MKDKLALVIAALMITSMALSISTTSVSAVPEPTTPSISPTIIRGDTRVLITITIGNASTATDNIENVLIRNTNFDEAIGGTAAVENLKLAADNMENAVAPLKRAGENLKLAADNMESDAGPAVASAGASLQTAAIRAAILVMENEVATSIEDAGLALEEAGDAMAAAPENFTLIASLLTSAADNLHSAAGSSAGTGENMWMENNNPAAAENLDNAAERIGDAATALEEGSLRLAGENLKIAGDNLENAGTALGGAAGTDFTSAGTSLRDAGQALIDAAGYENDAGYNLELVENFLMSVGGLIEQADTDDLKAAGDNLENAAAQIGFAADNMQADMDNILQAGDNLSEAATYLAAAATELGADLGGDELEDAMVHENSAAENLDAGNVDLGTAGDQLIAAADDISASATKLLATANALAPAGWVLTEQPNAKDVNFGADGDENQMAPGGSKSFTFLWKTPAPSTENDYTIQLWVYGGGDWHNAGTLTLTVDGVAPTLTIVVSQEGVSENNLVGTVYNDGIATITITASEELQSIGTVTVENEENFLPPITLTTTDDITFTGTFTVGAWDDNTCRVDVTSAKDLIGNENDAIDAQIFTVDTRAPVLVENGLSTLVGNMSSKVQAGTGTTYTYVDNTEDHMVTVTAQDNKLGVADNWQNLAVTISGETATLTPDNKYRKSITLSEELNSVVVTATDRTGNSTSDNVENIFIDTVAPSVSFDTVAGEIWDENAEITNDSTPTIVLSITDAGLGVAFENLRVVLDNNDNIVDGLPTWGDNLENASPYVWSVTAGATFENTIAYENGEPLSDGTYWIGVVASDNLAHSGVENVVLYRSFEVDATAPEVLPPVTGENPLSGATVSSPYVQKSATLTLSGTRADPDDTLSVYLNDATTAATTATVDSAGRWTVNISLTAGATTKVEVTLTDVAGNEGLRYLYGYVMADGTAPTVTLTTLPETTDKSSITISGTVSKDTWEDWSDITLTVQVGVGRVPVPIGAEGSYNYSLALSEGPNTIVVQATDEIGNASVAAHAVIERVVTPWAIYAIILVIVALILAAIAIFGGPRIWKR